MAQFSVLFVCLGNICRSPLAEAAFRAAAEEAGLDIHTDSAGTADYHVNRPPDPRSIATAAARGIDITHYRGRQIAVADYTQFTHIFALDQSNLHEIERRAPTDTTAEIALLLDVLEGREGEAVPDPYYGGPGGFELVWDEVNAAARAIAMQLVRA
jgi:protein-tyrosine phosphatase